MFHYKNETQRSLQPLQQADKPESAKDQTAFIWLSSEPSAHSKAYSQQQKDTDEQTSDQTQVKKTRAKS